MQIETTVEGLMDAMHAALLSADFDQLQRLTPDLETALLELGPQSNPKTLARLRAKSDRNAAAALAAGKGVRAAIQRLEEVRENATGLVTYDENGKRPLPRSGGELSRRL
jgi:hypothetical protein